MFGGEERGKNEKYGVGPKYLQARSHVMKGGISLFLIATAIFVHHLNESRIKCHNAFFPEQSVFLLMVVR